MTGSASPSRLFEEIGYDTALEAEALARLADLDLDGCRRDLGRLTGPLRLEGEGLRQRAVIGLLLDVLLEVNRRVHASPTDPELQAERQSLIERFSSYETAEAARTGFAPQLNRLLARLGADARPQHTVVERARRYIDGHYMERIFLSSVATKLNVSPNYLSRLFRERIGMTLTHYVQEKRVERACLMLAARSGTISEIAYRVGYQNYRDFYRNFVKLQGASPRVVQRRLGERQTG